MPEFNCFLSLSRLRRQLPHQREPWVSSTSNYNFSSSLMSYFQLKPGRDIINKKGQEILPMDKQQWINLLRQDVVPALGCTEPVCVALCAAYAAQQLCCKPLSVTVKTNAGIYKNGMSAGIPHCPQVGLHWAAAIGCFLKNPQIFSQFPFRMAIFL